MKFAVIGGTGLIGSRVVEVLNAAGHEAAPHSRSTGVDILTGKGLEAALDGADVVVDLTNSPTFDDASTAFFRASMDNLLAASRRAGVGHFVVLSIVGVDEVPVDYYRAKTLQEDLLKSSAVPYSIVRATQFMEFIESVLSWTADEETVRLPRTPIQPVAAADVAATVADVAAGPPLNTTVNLGGPDTYSLDELGRITLAAKGDKRSVTVDDAGGMFAAVPGDALTTKEGARIAPTRYTDWLK
ncbi:NAD(P)H-binding protein [Streptomyces kunmingensis]|uniref:NAD(P)H-binding protein n=1 Tax=Streptomyces kunmingensis TaxID=68225 RepID=A0ABU6C623_9ACTN|nr:NAD(P)H-binding protein [Streptomyces kunmingensis]MEB3959627.1 NAD(P)H-binding protein [Streptomyces kunmingensis]